jgi:hypothetical protein
MFTIFFVALVRQMNFFWMAGRHIFEEMIVVRLLWPSIVYESLFWVTCFVTI